MPALTWAQLVGLREEEDPAVPLKELVKWKTLLTPTVGVGREQ